MPLMSPKGNFGDIFMNRDRIADLITHLKTIKPPAFSMQDWLNVQPLEGADEYCIFEDDSTGFDYFAKHIPEYQESFKTGNECGTIGCIAGHAMVVAVKEGKLDKIKNEVASRADGHVRPSTLARAYLELTNEESSALFTPVCDRYDLITTKHAITVLQRFLDTNVIHWDDIEKEIDIAAENDTITVIMGDTL